MDDEMTTAAELPFTGPAEAAEAAEIAPVDDVGSMEEVPGDAETGLLAGKFKSAEALAEAYTELQSRFGQQGAELGELRTRMAEEDAWAFGDDPAARVMAAHAQGDEASLQEGFAEWVESDPDSATAWLQGAREQEAQAVAERQAADQAAWGQAIDAVLTVYPDFADQQQAVAAVIQESPALNAILANGDPNQKVEGLLMAIQLAKAGEVSEFRDAVSESARATAAAAREARQAAYVGSTEAIPPPETVDPGMKIAEQMRERIARDAGFGGFWTGRGEGGER